MIQSKIICKHCPICIAKTAMTSLNFFVQDDKICSRILVEWVILEWGFSSPLKF